MKKTLIFIFIISYTTIFCQETEKKSPVSGKFDLGLNYTKNKEEVFQFNNVSQLKYETKNKIVLFSSNVSFINKTGEEELINKGTQDLKYSYKTKKINSNISVQHLYDINRSVKRRWTTGVGFSVNIIKNEGKDINFGLTGLREKETTILLEEKLKNRMESSVIFSLQLNNNIQLQGFTKYLPNIEDFNDYRLDNTFSIRINLNPNFLLSINNTLNYDNLPEDGVNKTDYQLINSVSYTF